MKVGCTGKTVRSLDYVCPVPYLSTLEVCLRQGAIQIHVYLALLYLSNFWILQDELTVVKSSGSHFFSGVVWMILLVAWSRRKDVLNESWDCGIIYRQPSHNKHQLLWSVDVTACGVCCEMFDLQKARRLWNPGCVNVAVTHYLCCIVAGKTRLGNDYYV